MSTTCTPTQSTASETTTIQLSDSQAIASPPYPVRPINRSPDEILLNIFRCLVQPASGIPRSAQYDSGLLHASRVCGRWRAIAIGNASLWTEIQVYSAAQAKLFLERSRSLPVRIALANTYSEDSREDIYKEVVPHVSRIRLFFVSGAQTAEELRWWTKKLSAAPAPQLEELSLTTAEEWSTGSNVQGLPIFGKHTPRLRSLTIRALDFQRGASTLFSNLHHLDLTLWLDDFDPVLLSRTVLPRCPELETLALRGQYLDSEPQERAAAGPVQSRKVIALPRLWRLELGLNVNDTLAMLELLSLPDSTTFEIEVDSPSRSIQFPRALFVDQLPALHGLPSVEVVISDDWVGGYTDQSFKLYAGRDPALYKPTLCLSVTCTSVPWISNLCLVLDTDAIRHYTVDFNGARPHATFTQTLWQLALRDLAGLITLRVIDAAPVYLNLCAVLAGKEEGICPALEVLELHGVHCDEAFFRALGYMLTSRHGFSGALRCVRIKDAAGGAEYRGPELEGVRVLLDDFSFLS